MESFSRLICSFCGCWAGVPEFTPVQLLVWGCQWPWRGVVAWWRPILGFQVVWAPKYRRESQNSHQLVSAEDRGQLRMGQLVTPLATPAGQQES